MMEAPLRGDSPVREDVRIADRLMRCKRQAP